MLLLVGPYPGVIRSVVLLVIFLRLQTVELEY